MPAAAAGIDKFHFRSPGGCRLVENVSCLCRIACFIALAPRHLDVAAQLVQHSGKFASLMRQCVEGLFRLADEQQQASFAQREQFRTSDP